MFCQVVNMKIFDRDEILWPKTFVLYIGRDKIALRLSWREDGYMGMFRLQYQHSFHPIPHEYTFNHVGYFLVEDILVLFRIFCRRTVIEYIESFDWLIFLLFCITTTVAKQAKALFCVESRFVGTPAFDPTTTNPKITTHVPVSVIADRMQVSFLLKTKKRMGL